MTIVEQLGQHIEKAWKTKDYDERLFPDLIEKCLSETDLSYLGIDEIINWVVTAKLFPKQVNINSGFGQPPLTMYENDHFYIEALFWLSATTTIHEHNFSGAFYVLAGSSLHSEYKFVEVDRVNDDLIFGNLIQKNVEVLSRGEFRRIRTGQNFIHSLFHLDHPSVTLVIRTYPTKRKSIQYEYHHPHIAINSFTGNELTTRQFEILRMMKLTHNPNFSTYFAKFLKSSPVEVFVGISILLANNNLLTKNDIEQIQEAIEDRLKLNSKYVIPIFAQIERLNSIRVGRSTITSKDGRFLMALLMNVGSRQGINELISKNYPSSPNQLLKEWITTLNNEQKFNPPFEPFQMELIHAMLDSLSYDEVLEKLGNIYELDDLKSSKAEIRATFEALRLNPILSVLFDDFGETK